MDIVLQLLPRFSRNRKTSRGWTMLMMRSWKIRSSVRNIPKRKDGCDVMELWLFSRKMADRLSKRPQSPFRGSQAYFKDFSWGIHNFFLSGQRIESHIGSVSWNIQHTWCLSSSFKQHDVGEILVGFQGTCRWTSINYFFDSKLFYEVLDHSFPRLSYRLLTFIMLNVGMVDNLEFW